MAKKLTAILASAALFAAIAASAAPDKGKAKAKTPSCPTCKMELSTKKTAKNSVAVKIGGKTYYCCDKCPMGKKTAPAGGAKKK